LANRSTTTPFVSFGAAPSEIVDPIAKTLEIFGLEAARWVLLGTSRDDAKVRGEPFADFELELAGPLGGVVARALKRIHAR